MTTTLSACSSGLTSVLIAKVLEGAFCVERMGNGILAGLVGITAGCHVVEPWGAILVGMFSGMIFLMHLQFMELPDSGEFLHAHFLEPKISLSKVGIQKRLILLGHVSETNSLEL